MIVTIMGMEMIERFLWLSENVIELLSIPGKLASLF